MTKQEIILIEGILDNLTNTTDFRDSVTTAYYAMQGFKEIVNSTIQLKQHIVKNGNSHILKMLEIDI